ncbi:MAG: MerR family transcriptional regulator [Kineosporiaceae bacterium]
MVTHTIAQAADAAGTSTDTIRYYDREGLLAGLARDAAGNRCFTSDDIGWLRILRCLRDTGMTMADLRSFCAVDGEVRPADRLALLEAHRDRVLERIRQTHDQLAVIEGKIEAYRTSVAGTRAPEVTR